MDNGHVTGWDDGAFSQAVEATVSLLPPLISHPQYRLLVLFILLDFAAARFPTVRGVIR